MCSHGCKYQVFIPGEFILLPKVACSYAQLIKTNPQAIIELGSVFLCPSVRLTRIMLLTQEATRRFFRMFFSMGPELRTAQEHDARSKAVSDGL